MKYLKVVSVQLPGMIHSIWTPFYSTSWRVAVKNESDGTMVINMWHSSGTSGAVLLSLGKACCAPHWHWQGHSVSQPCHIHIQRRSQMIVWQHTFHHGTQDSVQETLPLACWGICTLHHPCQGQWHYLQFQSQKSSIWSIMHWKMSCAQTMPHWRQTKWHSPHIVFKVSARMTHSQGQYIGMMRCHPA